MSRSSVRLMIAYDGEPFAGWQRQDGVPTVQQALEEALGRLTGRDLVVHGAGRTDAGVHALGQVAHLSVRGEPGETVTGIAVKALVTGTNHFLPRQIRVLSARRLDTSERSFHARKSAVGKRYVYHLHCGAVAPPFDALRALHIRGRLDARAISLALAALPGRHDFSAFAVAGGSHTEGVRRLFGARLDESPAGHMRIEFWGEGFLRGMVRSLVGTLVEIGRGERPATDMARLLEPGRRRDEAGFTAPAHGLCLERVVYRAEWRLLESWGESLRVARPAAEAPVLPVPG